MKKVDEPLALQVTMIRLKDHQRSPKDEQGADY